MKNLIVLIVLSALLIGCGSTKFISTDEEWASASARNSELTRKDFDKGKKIYLNNCQVCHDLKDPAAYTMVQWTKLGPAMINNVNQKEEYINATDAELLTDYIMALAKVE